jgi:hypothetical protein
MTTAYIILVSYPEMDWDGNAKQQARDERFVAKAHTFSWFVFLGGAISLLLHKLIPAPFPVCPDRQQLGLLISPQLPWSLAFRVLGLRYMCFLPLLLTHLRIAVACNRSYMEGVAYKNPYSHRLIVLLNLL